jgi:hypothetical protein
MACTDGDSLPELRMSPSFLRLLLGPESHAAKAAASAASLAVGSCEQIIQTCITSEQGTSCNLFSPKAGHYLGTPSRQTESRGRPRLGESHRNVCLRASESIHTHQCGCPTAHPCMFIQHYRKQQFRQTKFRMIA